MEIDASSPPTGDAPWPARRSLDDVAAQELDVVIQEDPVPRPSSA